VCHSAEGFSTRRMETEARENRRECGRRRARVEARRGRIE
jgi:hypothetical protein